MSDTSRQSAGSVRQGLIWLLFWFTFAAALVTPFLAIIGRLEFAVIDMVFPAGGLMYAAVGLLITLRQPANRIGLLSLLTGGAMVLFTLGRFYAPASPPFASSLPGAQWAWLLVSFTGPLMILGSFFLLPLLFPDGRPLSARWRLLAWLVVTLSLMVAVLEILDPAADDISGAQGTMLALPVEQAKLIAAVRQLKTVLFFGWILGILVGPGSLLFRWRRSRGLTRRQLSTFVGLTSLLVGLQVGMEIIGGFIWPGFFETGWYEGLTALVWMSLPFVFGITVMRYRLYDVEVFINRTLVYGALSALLAAVYFGSVVVLQALFRVLSGGDSPLVIVLSTLIIAALFTPLRGRVQAFIDRRFYRRKYDARRTLERFAATARDEVDLERLTGALLQTVDETIQPDGLAIWLRESAARKEGVNG